MLFLLGFRLYYAKLYGSISILILQFEGTVTKLVLPVDINQSPIKIKSQKIPSKIELANLTDLQKEALKIIENNVKPTVIKGVTGSGKTELYFHAILNKINDGQQALIMLPEIALSMQIISRFQYRFGFEPVIWNSSVTKAQYSLYGENPQAARCFASSEQNIAREL